MDTKQGTKCTTISPLTKPRNPKTKRKSVFTRIGCCDCEKTERRGERKKKPHRGVKGECWPLFSLAFTRYCFNSRPWCISQSSSYGALHLHCPPGCNTASIRLRNIRAPLRAPFFIMPYTIIQYTILCIAISCIKADLQPLQDIQDIVSLRGFIAQ